MMSWISNEAKRPVKSVPAAKLLAAGEGIGEGKMLINALSEMLAVPVNLQVCLDSKDLFTFLSTQKVSIDKSIRGDVGTIRYAFETHSVKKVSWIPDSTNLADVVTRKGSALTKSLVLALFSGRLAIDLNELRETKDSKRKLG